MKDCKKIVVRTDNTPTLFTLKKGCAKEFELNDAIRRCGETFARIVPSAEIFAKHIPTEENPADPPSRGKFERSQPSAPRSLRVVESSEPKRVFTKSG